jgi:hypothetical protein
VSGAEIAAGDEPFVEASLRYLASDEAARSLEANSYWPKWNSPWWHLSVLYEMGLAPRVSRVAVERMTASVSRLLPVFFVADVPPGRNPMLDTPCPCSLGNIFQMLHAAGADVDRELPWARGWFMRYQMPDGGLSCDENAYRANPQASSMVGTVAPLEAILYATTRAFTSEETEFLDRGARCLLARELRLGCSAEHNREESDDEAEWLLPCFPRFYFYDTLRGLSFVLEYAERLRRPIPARAIEQVVADLEARFPDGRVRVGRHAFEGCGSWNISGGEWKREKKASLFPLLERVSEPGRESPYLSARWMEAKERLVRLRASRLLTS